MKKLIVTEIKRSIEVMDEFVDGDYDVLELKNWMTVHKSKNVRFSVYDNSDRFRISLIISKERDMNKPLCEYSPTMTEFRQYLRGVCLDSYYVEGSMLQIIRDACKTWTKNVVIPLSAEICLRAQTSYNRMDYGCEWLGGGDWEEKTMYGETTDFFISAIILNEPYKYVEQEAVEIIVELKNQYAEIKLTIENIVDFLVKSNDRITQYFWGIPRREGNICDFRDGMLIVQFDDENSRFIVPQCFVDGHLVSHQHSKTIDHLKQCYGTLLALEKEIKAYETAISENDFKRIYDLVSERKKF